MRTSSTKKWRRKLHGQSLVRHDSYVMATSTTGDPSSPHFKVNLMFQAHFMRCDTPGQCRRHNALSTCRLRLPISDYATDTQSALDQCMRILQVCLIAAKAFPATIYVFARVCAVAGWVQAGVDVCAEVWPRMLPACCCVIWGRSRAGCELA